MTKAGNTVYETCDIVYEAWTNNKGQRKMEEDINRLISLRIEKKV